MLRGPEPGRIYALSADNITIGRGRRNEIIIHDNEVSREHCRLVKVLFDYEIYDLNSTNGTFLNGRPVHDAATPIFDKNIIELGDSIVLEYIASREAPETPEPVPVRLVAAPVAADYYLVLRRKSEPLPEVYLLDSPVIDIGRHLDNTICLVENQVSRFHMRLNRIDQDYLLEDLGSVNGTFLNGMRVEKPHQLKPGDYITIGQVIEMWYTNDLETLKMVPRQYTVEQASRTTDEVQLPTPEQVNRHLTMTREAPAVAAAPASESPAAPPAPPAANIASDASPEDRPPAISPNTPEPLSVVLDAIADASPSDEYEDDDSDPSSQTRLLPAQDEQSPETDTRE
jgi:pSer/pThr/pTyr-binding forkhead associated (FHA) protein